MKPTLLIFLTCSSLTLFSQDTDTIVTDLPAVEIAHKPSKNEIERLPEIQGTSIYSGKKNEVIRLGNIDADLSVNNTRQVFGKVPGVTVWENDGSGIQVSVSARGLSPNRSWEFNVRQNGYDICAEAFGYPEAYYSPPMEALEKIEIVRGAGSLQYGPQFGGLLNYKIKSGNPSKPVSFETQQTAGSFGLFNSYNAIGGTLGKLSYYAYYHYRTAEGWRKNNSYDVQTGYASVSYIVNSKIKAGLQYTRMNYVSQQPGGLTDEMFDTDPRQSMRERNWMNVPWNIISFNFDYDMSARTRLSAKVFSTIAERNSVGFSKALTIADTFNVALGSFNPRQVDRDSYNNLGVEVRMLRIYSLAGNESALSVGVRAYHGEVIRRQLGIGTTDDDFDLSIIPQSDGFNWGRELNYSTTNYAAFAENLFRIGRRLALTPGVRYENILSTASGYINTTAAGQIADDERTRSFVLFGMGLEFKTSTRTNIYANTSQSYRPVTYSELTPSGTTDIIDPDLEDAKGYNIDLGYRGKVKDYLNFDIGAFYLEYDNRIGTITQDGVAFKTNIGTSLSKGIETFVEIDPIRMFTSRSRVGYLTLFTSYAFIDATYTRWDNPATEADPLLSVEGKRVENSPRHIGRYGITYILNKFSVTLQASQVGDAYADAANTVEPNAASTIGKIPAYTVVDGSMTLLFGKNYNLKAGVNNIGDAKYFTRRAGGYPGPGLMPANGRTIFMSVGAKF